MHRILSWLYTTLYRAVLTVLSPLGLVLALRRTHREILAARLGFYPVAIRRSLTAKRARRVWVHAVSAGEVTVAFAVVSALRLHFPEVEVVLTTTTRDGRAVAKRNQALGQVTLVASPFDLPGVIRRSFSAIQPDLLVLVELEFWPNLLERARLSDVAVCVVNARLPEREWRGYKRFDAFFRPFFKDLRLVAAQSATDADRLAGLGVPASRLYVTGNVKFDAATTAGSILPETADFLAGLCGAGRHPLIVAGSTHPGEEKILLAMARRLRRRYPGLLLVVAPRHITRAPQILRLAHQQGGHATLRSRFPEEGFEAVDTLIVDSMGELRFLYPLATVIFVGKSLCGRGGQNVIEAAASGNPVVWGPHMENFQEVAGAFLRQDASIQVTSPGELEEVILDLLGDAQKRAEIGGRAADVISRNRGSASRAADLLMPLLAPRE